MTETLQPIPSPPCNQRDRDALAEAAWLLAATTDVRVEVQTDYLSKLYKVNPGTGLQHEIGTRHYLVLIFTRGKDRVRVSLKERGIYRTSVMFDDVRIGSAVVIPEVLSAFYHEAERRRERRRRA